MNRQKREISLMHIKRKSQGSSVVEQRPEKPCVGSSILPLGTTKQFKMIMGVQLRRLERTSDKGEVGGSSPPTPTILSRELAQMARALGLGPRGREFESRIPEVKKLISYKIKRFSGYIALLDLVKYLEGGFEIGLVACYLLVGSAK